MFVIMAFLLTSVWSEWVDDVRLWKWTGVFRGLEGVTLSLRLAWSWGAAEIKRWLTLNTAARRRTNIVQSYKSIKSPFKICFFNHNFILFSSKEHQPFCQAETLPLFGVPGGSLFTFILRGVLASAGCSWVGDWSLSWGEGEGSCGDGDCNWGRDCDMGDWSWGAGDWSWAGGWGTGDWSWGPPPGVGESSLPCLAPGGPLRHGSSWVRGSMSTGPPDIWDRNQEKKNINSGTEMWWKALKAQKGKRKSGGRRNGENQETWKQTKRSKASEFQRAQLVAQPAAETKSKNINTERYLQQLSGHCYCKNNSEQRKIPKLNSK